MDTIFSGIADAYGVLSDSEKKNGTLLVNLGAGTTEYVVMNNYGYKAAGVLPIGMDHVINDLSLGLKLTLPLCRQLLESGKLEQILNNNEHFWEYELNRTTNKIPTSAIEAIVNARLQEIFDIIKIELLKKNCHLDLAMGGVLIGGGALLSRSHEIFSNTFNFRSRTGIAIGMTGNIGNLSTPRYVTTYGLLKLAHTCCLQNELPDKPNSPVNTVVDIIMNMIKKVKDSIKL
jgi:cell division protein FtsA